ncbi:MAG: DUF4142 domain-containing protein [Myxococcota bacterium]|nr:DUF4142 domain-containing protein [Myxococcota bacterium]
MRRTHSTIGLIALSIGLHAGAALADDPRKPDTARPGAQAPAAKSVTRGELDKAISNWPAKPKAVAYQMIKKYGLPQDLTSFAIVWHNNGPWKRTTIFKDELVHNFPKPHTDLLEQVIDARIPADKLDELGNYDGSVQFNRTAGELSARCDMEEMNFLALNLANDIATGKTSAAKARVSYGKNVVQFMTGDQPPAYTKGLTFEPAKVAAADADKVTMPGAPQPATAAANPSAVGDAQIIAALTTVNTNEVGLMHFVLMTTKDPKIQEFAQTLKKHHAEGLMKSMQLGPKTKVTPIDNGPVVEMKQNAAEGMAKLAQLDGAAFDKAFVALVIEGHTKTLDAIDNKLMPRASHEAVRTALTETRKSVSHHLELAKALSSKDRVSTR